MTRSRSARIVAALSAAAVAATGALLMAPGSDAAPTGAIGPATVINGPGSIPALTGPPAVATLANGATMVAWVSSSGATLHVRTRGATASTWSATRTYTASAGWTVFAGSPSDLGISVKALGPSRFLVVWIEVNGGLSKVRSATLPLSPASPTFNADTLSTGDSAPAKMRVATNAAGRAVVTWSLSSPYVSRYAVLGSPTGTWSAPASLTAANGSVQARGVVTESGAVCFAWLVPALGTTGWKAAARCRAANSTALLPKIVIARSMYYPVPPLDFAVTAVGEKVVLAISTVEPGVAPFPTSSVIPMAIRIFQLDSPRATVMTQKAVFQQPNQVMAVPLLATSSDGWVALSYLRLQGIVQGPSDLSFVEYTATRTPSGVWSAPSPILTADMANNLTAVSLVNDLAAGPGGAVLLTSLQPAPSTFAGWKSVASVRPSAQSAPRPLRLLDGESVVSRVAVAPSGQATFATLRLTSGPPQITVQTTALAGGAS